MREWFDSVALGWYGYTPSSTRFPFSNHYFVTILSALPKRLVSLTLVDAAVSKGTTHLASDHHNTATYSKNQRRGNEFSSKKLTMRRLLTRPRSGSAMADTRFLASTPAPEGKHWSRFRFSWPFQRHKSKPPRIFLSGFRSPRPKWEHTLTFRVPIDASDQLT